MPRAPTDIRSIARSWTETAIKQLGAIATSSESDAARVAACTVLLDRGWGKAPTTIEGDADIRVVIRHIIQSQLNPGDQAKLINGGDND
jgi:hypothetical protein